MDEGRLSYEDAVEEAWCVENWHREVLAERAMMAEANYQRLEEKWGNKPPRPLEEYEIPGFFESDEELEAFIADVREWRNESLRFEDRVLPP